MADPDWPNKAAAEAVDEIRRCVACNQGCLAHVFNNEPMECLVNGFAGREALLKTEKVMTAKKLLVVGGGPAGCEFAYRRQSAAIQSHCGKRGGQSAASWNWLRRRRQKGNSEPCLCSLRRCCGSMESMWNLEEKLRWNLFNRGRSMP